MRGCSPQDTVRIHRKHNTQVKSQRYRRIQLLQRTLHITNTSPICPYHGPYIVVCATWFITVLYIGLMVDGIYMLGTQNSIPPPLRTILKHTHILPLAPSWPTTTGNGQQSPQNMCTQRIPDFSAGLPCWKPPDWRPCGSWQNKPRIPPPAQKKNVGSKTPAEKKSGETLPPQKMTGECCRALQAP